MRFLKLFTELPLDEIDKLGELQGAALNEAKKVHFSGRMRFSFAAFSFGGSGLRDVHFERQTQADTGRHRCVHMHDMAPSRTSAHKPRHVQIAVTLTGALTGVGG